MVRCTVCELEYVSGDSSSCPACRAESVAQVCERCGEEFAGSDACPACGLAAGEFACEAHPDRRARGCCVICERALCRECVKGDGRVYRCAEHAAVPIIQGWAQVYTSASEFEGRLVLENLLAEGVDARMFSQKDAMFTVDVGELSIVRLLVPAWDYSRADEIIRGHMDEEGEVAFACIRCGEAYEPGAVVCASCGARITTGPAN